MSVATPPGNSSEAAPGDALQQLKEWLMEHTTETFQGTKYSYEDSEVKKLLDKVEAEQVQQKRCLEGTANCNLVEQNGPAEGYKHLVEQNGPAKGFEQCLQMETQLLNEDYNHVRNQIAIAHGNVQRCDTATKPTPPTREKAKEIWKRLETRAQSSKIAKKAWKKHQNTPKYREMLSRKAYAKFKMATMRYAALEEEREKAATQLPFLYKQAAAIEKKFENLSKQMTAVSKSINDGDEKAVADFLGNHSSFPNYYGLEGERTILS